MSDPFSGIIDNFLRETYNQGEIEMWRGLSVPCTLIHKATKTPCSDCGGVTIGGLPGNFTQAGLPVPVFSQVCPFCGGTGYKEETTTEEVKMQINVDPKGFLATFKPLIIEAPQNFMETKARLEDMPAILKCSEMIINNLLQGWANNKYSRASGPVPSGMFQNKFFHMLWKING
jgi:hypothetical protein